MIDPKELAEALRGCKFVCRWNTASMPEEDEVELIITEVTPPPKKPEVEVMWMPIWKDGGGTWSSKPERPGAIPPDYWLRRETIDGVPMQPTVVSAGERK